MKILHTVEYYDPFPGGMTEVVKRISEGLVKNGHSVTVATTKHPNRSVFFLNGVNIIEFDITGNSVLGMTGDTTQYLDFLLKSDFDIITNFAAQQWATDIMLPILKEIKGKKIFVPTGFSAINNPSYRQYYERMVTWLKQYDKNVFLSNVYQDIEFARKHGISNYTIIPNGASAEEFLSTNYENIRGFLKISKKTFLILHVGNHTGIKGHAEAIRIFKESNITDSTLVIIGGAYSPKCYHSCKIKEFLFKCNLLNVIRKKKIIIRSLTRSQTVSLFLSSDLFIFPSNIECSPIVLFECMASKTPFLTTDVGNATEIIDLSKSGVLLPTVKHKNGLSYANIEPSITIIENLYKNQKLRKFMQENGFKIWLEHFTWEKIILEYEDLYKEIIGNTI